MSISPDTVQYYVQIALLILALVVGWTILKFVLRLAGRVFRMGCGGILFIGIILFLINYFRIH